jgi:hypothetical protein
MCTLPIRTSSLSGQGISDFDSICNAERYALSGYVSAELFPLPDADTAAQKTMSF